MKRTKKAKATRKQVAQPAEEFVVAEQAASMVAEERKLNVNPLSIAVSVFVIGALLVVGVMKHGRDVMVDMRTKRIPEVIKQIDPAIRLKGVKSLKEVSGVYEFELEIDAGGKAQTFTSYITKDGKLFFVNGIKLDAAKKTADAKKEPQKKLSCSDMPKAEQSNLTAFVVADCPFGLQMQRAMAKAMEEKPELAKAFSVKYIGEIIDGKIKSMHGDKEAAENLKQICIREEQPELYWPYVSCYMKEGKSQECSVTARVDEAKLSSCQTDPKRGNAYAQKDFDLAGKFKVTGSPTLLLNGGAIVSEFDYGGRTPNALKELVCCGSTNKPGFCSTELTKDNVAPSFSVTGEAAAGSQNAAANCGN